MLDSFRKTGDHLAFVINEYGNILGLVTLHDLLEAITGAFKAETLDDQRAVLPNILDAVDTTGNAPGAILLLEARREATELNDAAIDLDVGASEPRKRRDGNLYKVGSGSYR